MSRLLPVILAAAMAPLGIAQADELTIQGIGISRDIDCHGKDVGVYGAENEIALTGQCGLITVHGSKHKVSFEEGRALLVSGMDNTVKGGKAQDVTVSVAQNVVTATLGGGSAPGRLDMSGANNRVSLILAGPTRLAVNGVDHLVEWTRSEGAPNPEVTASGAKNVIKRKP
ncbi:hypothetical protein ASF53_23705 [Methylobacterium sp. Leaf123]|uniref:DUF3060 domain-containing protein n=1 Tax=Methylobacterium sp. Leaf123 TaxID=1736264 RepID=UPI0006FA0FC0|nr:DUF3060 domain-containing protein [Methylobacterium sp. Leaf123]KQQ20134.1 hypothetical protein ASF53_23705 [Methylobacterium sp. Leaf123]